MTFDELEADYTRMIAAAKMTRPSAVNTIVTGLLIHRDRFLTLQQATGVPALWVMPVFYRERPSFDAYLGNGDPLNAVTTRVPAGRGPFATWEAGARDALELEHITQVEGWTWERLCYQWEAWNGFGPRAHGRPTGYVWSGTDQYQGGKYIADGPGGWSPGTWDSQLGCFAIAKAIAELDEVIGQGFLPAKPTSAKGTPAMATGTAQSIEDILKLFEEVDPLLAAVPGIGPLLPFINMLLPVAIQAVDTVAKATGDSQAIATTAVINHLTPGKPNTPALS